MRVSEGWTRLVSIHCQWSDSEMEQSAHLKPGRIGRGSFWFVLGLAVIDCGKALGFSLAVIGGRKLAETDRLRKQKQESVTGITSSERKSLATESSLTSDHSHVVFIDSLSFRIQVDGS